MPGNAEDWRPSKLLSNKLKLQLLGRFLRQELRGLSLLLLIR